MSETSQAVDDAIRICGDVIKMTAFISFGGAKFFAGMIEKVIKNAKRDDNYRRFEDMVSNRREVAVFPLFRNHEEAFALEASHQNLSYCILKDRDEKCEIYPLIVKKEDANRVNRMFETLSLYDFTPNPRMCEASTRDPSEAVSEELERKMNEMKNEIEDVKSKVEKIKDEKELFPTCRSNLDNLDRESVRKKIEEIRLRRDRIFGEVSRMEKGREIGR